MANAATDAEAPADSSEHDLPGRAGLEGFLHRSLPHLSGSMRIERAAGGQSNPTFILTFDNGRVVLRKRPAGHLLPSAHAIDREFRIQSALASTGVPVPRMLLEHSSPDLIGTSFYVMEHLDGRVFHDNALPTMPPLDRRPAYRQVATTLARIHALDWNRLGLADFGRHDAYFQRQIRRWTRQWEISRTRSLDDIDALIEWLPRNLPADEITTIVHGDYRVGNLMFHPDKPEIAAVFDWELSTLGHPLADLSHSCIAWYSTPAQYCGVDGLDLDALALPSAGEYAEDYYRHASHGLRMTKFHLAFALFRFAVIFEGIASRAIGGNAAAGDARLVGALSEAFARRAIDVVDGRVPL